MIKRSSFKCCFLTTLIMIGISLCLLIAVIIYQSTLSFSGIGSSVPTSPTCSDTYLSMKATKFNINLIFSFIFLCIQLFFTILTFIFVLIGFIKFRESVIMHLDEDQTVIEQKNKTVVFSKKGIILLYILCSIIVICNTVYFGLMLAYTVQFSTCTNYLPEPLILTILSGISQLLLLTSWIILFTINGQLNTLIQMNKKKGEQERIYTIGEFTEMNILQSQQQQQKYSPRRSPKHYTKPRNTYQRQMQNINRKVNDERQFATINPVPNKSDHSKTQSEIKVDETPKFTGDRKQNNQNRLLKGSYVRYMEKQSPSNERQEQKDHPYFKSLKRKKYPDYQEDQEQDYSNSRVRKDKQLMWSNNNKILHNQQTKYIKSHQNTVLKGENVSERSFQDEQGISSRRKRKKQSKMLIDVLRNKYAD